MQIRKIFCVIDPTTTRQRALNRAAEALKRPDTTVHAYVCIEPVHTQTTDDREELMKAEVARYEAWLERLVGDLPSQGGEITMEVDVSEDWREALAPAAKRYGADLIIKSSHQRHPLRRRLLKTSDWTLLRAAHCPVLLVKRDRVEPPTTVIAAVNLGAKDEEHGKLTDRVIEYANLVAEATGAELHAANAYSGSLNFVHPPDLAKRVGIERSRAHVGDKSPEELIADLADELDNPLIVIGSIARRGVPGVVVGNTAERILDTSPADILTVMASQEE